MIFQKYFNIVYLGQKIKCSIEFPQNQKIEFNKIDLASAETNQKTVSIDLKINTNYPIINEQTEISGRKIINNFYKEIDLEKNSNLTDTETQKLI